MASLQSDLDKTKQLHFTTGQDWIIEMFFWSSEVRLWMKNCWSESTSHNVFPDLPRNLFGLPLLHLCKVLTISLNLLLSPFPFVPSFCFWFFFCFLFFFYRFCRSSFSFPFLFVSVCLVNRQNFNHVLVEILRWQRRFLFMRVSVFVLFPGMWLHSVVLVLSLRYWLNDDDQ